MLHYTTMTQTINYIAKADSYIPSLSPNQRVSKQTTEPHDIPHVTVYVPTVVVVGSLLVEDSQAPYWGSQLLSPGGGSLLEVGSLLEGGSQVGVGSLLEVGSQVGVGSLLEGGSQVGVGSYSLLEGGSLAEAEAGEGTQVVVGLGTLNHKGVGLPEWRKSGHDMSDCRQPWRGTLTV